MGRSAISTLNIQHPTMDHVPPVISSKRVPRFATVVKSLSKCSEQHQGTTRPLQKHTCQFLLRHLRQNDVCQKFSCHKFSCQTTGPAAPAVPAPPLGALASPVGCTHGHNKVSLRSEVPPCEKPQSLRPTSSKKGRAPQCGLYP